MDVMLLVQGACCSNQWLAAVLLSLCCLLPSCLPAGQSVDFPGTAVENLVVRKGDTAVLRSRFWRCVEAPHALAQLIPPLPGKAEALSLPPRSAPSKWAKPFGARAFGRQEKRGEGVLSSTFKLVPLPVEGGTVAVACRPIREPSPCLFSYRLPLPVQRVQKRFSVPPLF
ncbi:neuronal growth regulator 1 [Crotalus adamanteus]|uniref:Neuronal growth regulator 1 n=1 Tax=Crotalus adamanteus TaxID=8729 RepID=A0AAW1BPB6_CROAD